jgi:hypothetical protein
MLFLSQKNAITTERIAMAILAQPLLFGWEEIEILGDLSRLDLVLRNLPDEELMQTLERKRGQGRDDYPIRAMWNSLLAGIVFQHSSAESLRRELLRNAQLRLICGFDPCRGEKQACPDLHRGHRSSVVGLPFAMPQRKILRIRAS